MNARSEDDDSVNVKEVIFSGKEKSFEDGYGKGCFEELSQDAYRNRRGATRR